MDGRGQSVGKVIDMCRMKERGGTGDRRFRNKCSAASTDFCCDDTGAVFVSNGKAAARMTGAAETLRNRNGVAGADCAPIARLLVL